MIHLVYAENRSLYQRELDRMFQLRHKVFVEKRQWRLNSVNGREVDEFDTDETVYLLKIAPDGNIGGSMRFLPTTRPHLLSKALGETVIGEVPSGPEIWESSRGCVQNEMRGAKTFGEINVAMIEFALIWGIEAITFVLDTDLFPAAVAVGWDLRPLGLPVEMDGESYTAGILRVTPETLKTVRRVTGLFAPQLYIDHPENGVRRIA